MPALQALRLICAFFQFLLMCMIVSDMFVESHEFGNLFVIVEIL